MAFLQSTLSSPKALILHMSTHEGRLVIMLESIVLVVTSVGDSENFSNHTQTFLVKIINNAEMSVLLLTDAICEANALAAVGRKKGDNCTKSSVLGQRKPRFQNYAYCYCYCITS